ncbi:MAG: 4-demethylwyosine synthase TYW1 [Candidatus Micrarchaeota archaeon]
MMNEEAKRVLLRQKYKLLGDYGAAKLCHWTKKSILGEGVCYKEQFYGINSHRCLQMTPCVSACTQRCLFCWRAIENTDKEMLEYDEPALIVEQALEAQKEMLSGYGGIAERIDAKKYQEAMEPKNAAISLSGEPALYPKLKELVELLGKHGMSTFIVSNGTVPEAIAEVKPTQLYLSLCAPNEEVYKKLQKPLIPKAWEKVKASLDVMGGKRTRKAIRITAVKGHNDFDVRDYAKLIERANPWFVEVKSYMHVGFSIHRLGSENMMEHVEVQKFARELAEELGYDVGEENEISRVVMLARDGRMLEKRYINKG